MSQWSRFLPKTLKREIVLDWEKFEKSEQFIKWVGSVVDGYYRFAVILPAAGTGVKWVKHYPGIFGSAERNIQSHGNFYGETGEEAIAAAELAIRQILMESKNTL